MADHQGDVVTLRTPAEAEGLRFVSAQLLPHRSMMIYQIRAWLPGRGEIDVLAAPPLEEGLERLDGGPADFMGNASFSMGAAFLAPFVNRIRGRHDPVRREIHTTIAGKAVVLPANGGGKAPGTEQYAIHGLILDKAASGVERSERDGSEVVRGRLGAGDFGGRWPSSTDLDFEVRLGAERFEARMTASNAGAEPLPIGLGWHPYFNIPSGDRGQARMRLPAAARLPVNDYDEVLPTGEVRPVAGTSYDFRGPDGRALGDMYLDDCFVDLEKSEAGETVCEVIDPAAQYGLRIVSTSPQVSALQTFAPLDRPFLVIEPQFSWADPYGQEWDEGVDTGMLLLEPGQSVDYLVRLELFRPQKLQADLESGRPHG